MLERFLQPLSFPQSYVLSDRELPLKVVANSRAKRLTLRIESGGKGLRVTIPPGTRNRDVQHFIDRYRGWLENRLAGLPAPTIDGPMLKDGVTIPLFGNPHRIVYTGGRGVTDTCEQEGELQIIVHGEERYLARRVRDFLKKQAEGIITLLVAKHSQTVGCKPKSIRYKDTVSRWGSCSASGHLSFSWRIVMAPEGVIDYLVAHEVAHLIEMNHGPRFWTLCEKLCPETRQCRIWLKRNGQALHAIDFN